MPVLFKKKKNVPALWTFFFFVIRIIFFCVRLFFPGWLFWRVIGCIWLIILVNSVSLSGLVQSYWNVGIVFFLSFSFF